MRLVLLVPDFPKASETFIVDKLSGLHARGWDVHLVAEAARPQDAPLFPELSRPGLAERVHAWPPRGARRVAFAIGNLLHATATQPLALLRCIRAELGRSLRGAAGRVAFAAPLLRLQPDLLHYEFGSLAAHRVDLPEALGCRASVSFRGFDLNYHGLEEPGFYDEVFAVVDRVHVLGEDLESRARARGLPGRLPVERIPPAVDPSFFRPEDSGVDDATARPLRLLGVGRLHWKKGIEYALAAARRLVDEGVALEYRILGAGPFEEATRACIADLGLEAQVRLEGAAGREAVRQALQWSDLLVHAAVSEGFCNAVLEAQAMARPVVCSDADGLRENVEDGRSGFVVARRDPEALAEAIQRLADDPDLRREMGRAGRARIEARFTRERQLDAIEAFYRELA